MSLEKEYVSNKKAELIIKSAQGDLSVSFPAFLTAFNNSFTSTWNEELVYGRQDPIGTFQGTKRTISLGFDIIASNQSEAEENLKKINILTRMLYPSYAGSDDGNRSALSLAKAPLVTLQFGNLIQEVNSPLLGWINNWSANPAIDMGMFTGAPGMFYPKVFNATLDFSPQHRQLLNFNSGSTSSPVNFPYKG
jgi:hypothetical protein